MKKFLKTITWLIGIPLFIVLIFGVFGFLAIRFNFWPPNCGVLPIPQAKRVCEFSKLDKAPKGKPAEITFWATVPHNTPPADKIFLAIDGKEPKEMKRINNTSFETTLSLITGENLSYRYFRNAKDSVSEAKQYAVKSYKKTIYDYVSDWSDLFHTLHVKKDIVPFVTTHDTWTINYHMNLFEDTRRNLDSTFARIAAIGGKKIIVYSFIDMLGDDKDSITLEEVNSPYKSWRDATISRADMKNIAKTAKKYGLEAIISYNVGADYTKYVDVRPWSTYSGRGYGGDAAERKAGADFGRDDPKTKSWLDSEFSQLQTILVRWAKNAEETGIDAINVTPEYRMPPSAPLDAYADAKYSGIIKAMREVYHGKIYASNNDSYGTLRGLTSNPKYINDADALIFSLGAIIVPEGAGVAEMRAAWNALIERAETELANYKKPVYATMGAGGYKGANNGRQGMEWGDFAEVEQAGYVRDWQGQADSYEAFFEALAGKASFFAGIGIGYKYEWDDIMAPDYAGTRNDLNGNIRGTPAEAVWKKWVLSAE